MAGPSRLSTGKEKKARVTLLLAVLAFAASELIFWLFSGVLEPWNARAIDQLFILRSAYEPWRPAYDDTVVHVDINNSTIHQLRSVYLNRALYAQVVSNLAAMGAAVQAFDFIFAAPLNEPDDLRLIEATREAGSVYYGVAFALAQGAGENGDRKGRQPAEEEVAAYIDATAWKVQVEGDCSDFYLAESPLITFPALSVASRGLGFLSIKQDRDGVFRRIPLLVRCNDGAFYPSLAFRIACDFLGVTPENVLVRAGKSVTLKGARRPGQEPRHIVIPIDRRGNMIINYIGPWERINHYNFADIFRASQDRDELAIWREELNGKIVIISDVSTGSTDIGPVPTDAELPLSGLHANVVHTILSSEFLREFSRKEMLLIEVLLAGGVLLLALRFSSLTFSLGTGALAVAYVAAAGLLFLYGRMILHVVRPLFLLTSTTVLVTAYRYIVEEREKLVVRKTFEAYFPPSVVEKVMADPGSIAAMCQRKELTILFSDIKSFTTYASTLSPDQIRRSLNRYFDEMVEIVFKHGGTVDKYIGDGLMVFFGDPEPLEDHAVHCVRAAIEMQKRVRDLREKWLEDGGIPIHIRIGVNTGEVVVGNMGSAQKLSYTVLGSAVNMAQRLESNAPVDGILVSERTWELVRDHVETQALGEIRVKGIDAPVSVHEVLVDAEPGQPPDYIH